MISIRNVGLRGNNWKTRVQEEILGSKEDSPPRPDLDKKSIYKGWRLVIAEGR